MPAPTVERLKIRCYRCNQLLAVVPTKVGSVVSCPKCQAELLIPRPESSAPAESSDPSVAALKSGTYQALTPVSETPPPTRPQPRDPGSQAFLDEIAAIIPPEVASLRPEDLRVEADVFASIIREPAPSPPSAESSPSSLAEEPFQFPGDFQAHDVSPRPASSDEMPETLGASVTTEEASTAASVLTEVPPPLPVAAVTTPAGPAAAAVVPPITIEPAPIRPALDAEPRSIREVVLPVSIVLGWMILVLASIPMAFLAGLMIGHFLWKAGP